MAVMQVWLLLVGRTQVEHQCCKGRAYACHFDRGWHTNVVVVFGANPWLWLLPLPRYDVSELSYEAFTPSIAPPEPPPTSSLLDASATAESDSLLRGDGSFSAAGSRNTSNNYDINGNISGGTGGSGGVDVVESVNNPLRWMEKATAFEGGAFDWVEKDSNDAVN